MLADDVGPRQHQQVVVALQVARVILEALAAEVGLGQLVPLDHRAHRAVEDEDALREQSSSQSCRSSCMLVRAFAWLRAIRGGFVPDATSTVNGSPALRAPTPTLTSRSPAAVSSRFSSPSSEPEASDRRASPAPIPPVLPQVEHQHAAARHGDSRGLLPPRAPDSAHDAAPATAARRRPSRP